MSTIPANETERNRDEPGGLDPVRIPPANRTCHDRTCAKYEGEHDVTNHSPRKVHRRQQCATFPNIPGTAQPRVARSATELLAWFGTTPADRLSVRRGARTASERVRKATADGCASFIRSDNGRRETTTLGGAT
jgi:hypothetical protein